ncbi:hypothetical protein CSPAE12_04910 [Colletotrichum incanum]|nr:hypothetical protein CSPAE12_04910 [Colletotrichum incanum]
MLRALQKIKEEEQKAEEEIEIL